MRIGLDIDNVITDFDKMVCDTMLKEDKNKRNKGVINPKAEHCSKGMFDWSKEEYTEFSTKNMENLAKKMHQKMNCKKIIDKLIEEGHEIYLITHRVYPDYSNPVQTTKEWLKKHEINYHKLIFSDNANKSKECKENKIDIIFDDRVSACIEMKNEGINCYVMQTRYNKDRIKTLPNVKSWLNLYSTIEKLTLNKNL